MALHFEPAEFAARRAKVKAALAARDLAGLLLFSPESMYWLTGYDTFGFCFFQCLVFRADGTMALLTRSADLRQAQHTSNIEDIRIWTDEGGAQPAAQLKALVADLGLEGDKLGIETETQGLTYANGRAVHHAFDDFATLVDASDLIPPLRNIKSAAEMVYVRRAAALADKAYDAALEVIRPGADEGDVLAAMQGAIFSGGGDYAGNEFIIGSGRDALLCRYKAGRRVLDATDQITLEWAGAYRRYHAAMMRTVCVGKATTRHEAMYAAANDALDACEAAMQAGNTFGDVFDAHADAVDSHGMRDHRLNACGYNLGAHFTPCWMDFPMFFHDNPAVIEPGMVLFAHMILMDSDTGTAMTLGRTYAIGELGVETLSRSSLDLPVCSG